MFLRTKFKSVYKLQQCTSDPNNTCSFLFTFFHISAIRLDGQPFYAIDGKPYCEGCHMNTLEKCSVCRKAITDRVRIF